MENPAPTFRIYRLKWGQRAFALFFLAIAIFFMIPSWGEPITGRAEAKPIEMLIAIVLFITGLGLTFSFYGESIFYRGRG
jgi:hypothetical protein